MRRPWHRKARNVLEDVPNNRYVQLLGETLLRVSADADFPNVEGDQIWYDQIWYKNEAGRWSRLWLSYRIDDDGAHVVVRFRPSPGHGS